MTGPACNKLLWIFAQGLYVSTVSFCCKLFPAGSLKKPIVRHFSLRHSRSLNDFFRTGCYMPDLSDYNRTRSVNTVHIMTVYCTGSCGFLQRNIQSKAFDCERQEDHFKGRSRHYVAFTCSAHLSSKWQWTKRSKTWSVKLRGFPLLLPAYAWCSIPVLNYHNIYLLSNDA